MRALHQVHIRHSDRRFDGACDLRRPGSGGVDQHPRPAFQARRSRRVIHVNAAVVQSCSREGGRHCEFAAQLQRRLHHGARQQCIVGLRIMVANHRIEILGLQAIERGPVAARHAAEARSRIKSSEQRVHPESELQLPRPPPGVAIHRNEERLQFDQFGGDAQMNCALAQALAHQGKLSGFQVAQSAMNELAGATRRAAGKRPPFDEQGAVSRSGGSLKYTGAMNTAADDDHIVFFHFKFGA